MLKINESKMKELGYIKKKYILNPEYECFAKIGDIETYINFNKKENTIEKENRDFSVPFTEIEIRVISTFLVEKIDQ